VLLVAEHQAHGNKIPARHKNQRLAVAATAGTYSAAYCGAQLVQAWGAELYCMQVPPAAHMRSCRRQQLVAKRYHVIMPLLRLSSHAHSCLHLDSCCC
jgi:hypothetical protein